MQGDGTAHNRFIEKSEYCPADVKRPLLPQKIDKTLALPVECCGVFNPLQFIVSVHSEVFIVLHNIPINLLV